MTSTVLITGANRGIGLEFVRQYCDAGWHVSACCREPDRADALNAIAQNHPASVSVYSLDVTHWGQISTLAKRLQDQAIDVLINSAGVPGQTGSRFGIIDPDIWLNTFRVNTLGPLKIMEAFVEHVARGQRKLMVNVSSRMGSIADNESGGGYVYRSSKAALNAVVKSAAIDLRDRGITVIAVHPGWVKTDMGGPNALMTAEQSVTALRRISEHCTLEQSGRFFNYDGSEIPW